MADILKGRPGRKKGKPAPKTSARKALSEKAIAAGITPLEYMLGIIRSPMPTQIDGEELPRFIARLTEDAVTRLMAARYAAPYVHPRVATEIRLKTDNQADKPVDILELAKSVAFILTMAESKQSAIDVTPTSKRLN